MNFLDLLKKEQNHLNGKIGKYMDDFIRRNQLWTPKQMFEQFMLQIENEIIHEDYTIFNPNKPDELSMKKAVNWLTTRDGEELVIKRMTKKFEKDIDVVDQKKPMIERVSFGKRWSPDEFYTINFGLKTGVGYIPMEEFKNLRDIPWTVEFINNELSKYNKTLTDVLTQLCESPLEKIFSDFWLKNICKNDSPALIPEVCGFRRLFYYYEFKGENYRTRQEIPRQNQDKWSSVKSHNFRYDFALINYKRQKIGFIELDGFEYHKSRPAQTKDSIKRNHAMRINCNLFNFTSKRINDDIESVFNEIEDFVR